MGYTFNGPASFHGLTLGEIQLIMMAYRKQQNRRQQLLEPSDGHSQPRSHTRQRAREIAQRQENGGS